MKMILACGLLLFGATRLPAEESKPVVWDSVKTVRFPHGYKGFDGDGTFRKLVNPERELDFKAYRDVDGKRRFYTEEQWNRFLQEGTLPAYAVGQAPRKKSKQPEDGTHTLNFVIVEDLEPDPPKPAALRDLDFRQLPDYGKNSGKGWKQRWADTQGEVKTNTTIHQADFFYDWGSFNVYWIGSKHPPPRWETQPNAPPNTTWAATKDRGATHWNVMVEGKEIPIEIHHPTKHITLRIWNPTPAVAAFAGKERMESLAVQYFELLAPYAQPRKNPIAQTQSTPLNVDFSNSLRKTDDLNLVTPHTPKRDDAPLLGQ